jgi:integral membrane sensor domain MASE1
MKEFPGLFWHHIRSWQFVYLVFFTVGNSLSIYFSDTTTTSASYWSPFALMIVALLVELISFGEISV